MSERDEAEQRFQAWVSQQALGPQPRKYDRPSARSRCVTDTIVMGLSVVFWAAVLFGMARCVGQVMAQPATQPSVQNPFRRGRPPPAPTRERPRMAPAGPADAEVAKRLIAESIARYRGSCACPYQSDRAGRSCGRRSAYHHPRGAVPVCFVADVTPEMLAKALGHR